jgi:hypothetical protein
VDVGEVLDFVASSLDRHKHKARGKESWFVNSAAKRYTKFYSQNLRGNTLETL